MVARAVTEFGHVDVMCNNAAAPGTDKFIWEQTLENWNATIAIDVTAAMLCTREVLNQSMLERECGRDPQLLLVGELRQRARAQDALRHCQGAHYTRSRKPFRGRWVRRASAATASCPAVSTPTCSVDGCSAWPTKKAWTSRRNVPRFWAAAALRDISSPEDQANLALFLASDECLTITGQSIVCDGGVYMLG